MKAPSRRGDERAPDKARCDMVEPPDFLKGKLIKGSGLDPEEVERRAEATIGAMREDYLHQAHKDLARTERALAKARLAAGDGVADSLQEILWIVHEMRGQAGTFDYDLVTSIGTALCKYIEEAESPDQVRHDVLSIFVDGMRAVITGGVTGDGGDTGRTLIAGMNARIAKTATVAAE